MANQKNDFHTPSECGQRVSSQNNQSKTLDHRCGDHAGFGPGLVLDAWGGQGWCCTALMHGRVTMGCCAAAHHAGGGARERPRRQRLHALHVAWALLPQARHPQPLESRLVQRKREKVYAFLGRRTRHVGAVASEKSLAAGEPRVLQARPRSTGDEMRICRATAAADMVAAVQPRRCLRVYAQSRAPQREYSPSIYQATRSISPTASGKGQPDHSLFSK